ncbi:biotin-dependent carboxyltransferase family protein [Campylobacter sp. 19-13652]|uniref:5-oxoprolinase subunit C family protein n=1 Tax=Campylobacter sp. 19-13652 TaxID=2840180 RepID=UPI001C7650BF|nr:biotin-dependent carboxyltransferase family protein [Campylobacter sp. 19-13652]BCX79839.1 hypothetical protein LBC_13010 [Campylobacter sp. 19-13652]
MIMIQVAGFVGVQDLGRNGFLHSGVGVSGAMDKFALMAANAALGNDLGAAGLEIMGAVSVEFTNDSNFILTGTEYKLKLNDTYINSYTRYSVKKGDILSIEGAIDGMYGYLAISGGIDVPVVLGARAQSVSGGFGGFCGRFLKSNDELKIHRSSPLKPLKIQAPQQRESIRILASSEWSDFIMPQTILAQPYKLTSNLSRMGYRLEGELALKPRKSLEMPSHGVMPGVVQIPPNGQPIVLMKDAQTTGGYPKIATVIDADLGHLAQKRPAQSVQFELISVKNAILASKELNEQILKIKELA